MTGGGKRAALYLRISKLPKGARSKLRDESGASYSVEDQDARCTELCEREGYNIVDRFYDDGISAYRSLKDRPGYGDMKAALADSAFDVLVFDRQDRLARDESETMRFVADCKDAGIAWHSDREGRIDLSEPVQRLSAIMRGGEAERYSASISTNQKLGNQHKREQGLPGAGPRPFGYEKWDPNQPDVQPLRADEADLIRRGTEMILAGAPRYQVTKMFSDSGVKTANGKEWHSAKVTKILSRWRNAGLTEYLDVPLTVGAIWPAIVRKEDVENVRVILSRGRAPGRWKMPTMLCSGIARCRCGYQLVATGSKVGPSYRCGELIAKGKANVSPGSHVTIAAKLLDPVVRDVVIDAYFKRPATTGAGKSEAATLARMYERRNELVSELDRAKRGFMAGILDEADAARETARLKDAIAELDRETANLAASSAHAAMLEASMNALTADLDLDTEQFVGNTFNAGLALAQSAVRAGKSYEEARNVLAQAPWWGLDASGEPEWRVDPIVWAAVADRFDAMPLEQQRHLVRSLVMIDVKPGQGKGRVAIEPL